MDMRILLVSALLASMPGTLPAFDFVLPEGRDAIAFPFLYESEQGDPDGVLLSDRQAMLHLGWDDDALYVDVDAMDTVQPGDGVDIRLAGKNFSFPLVGQDRFSASIRWQDAGLTAGEGVKVGLDILRTRAADVRGADRLGDCTVTLSRMASRWSFAHPVRLGDRWFASKFSMTAINDGKANFCFGLNGYRPLNFWRDTSILLKKGETRTIPFKGGSMDRGRLKVEIVDVDGRKLFGNEWHFRVNKPVAVRVIRSLPEKDLLLLETDNRVYPDEDYRIRLTMKDWETDKRVVWDKTVPAARCRGVTNQVYDVSDLKPGVYNTHFEVVAPDGKVVDAGRRYYAKEDGKPEWLGRKMGEDDSVPVPWTVPVASDNCFECWGRRYCLGGNGLVKSMFSQGTQLLSGPVSIILNDERLDFDVKCTHRRNTGAEYRLVSSKSGVTADISLEFDGFLWCNLKWGGSEMGEVRAFDVEIPLNRVALKGMEIGPNGSFHVFGKTNAVWRIDPTRRPCFWAGDGRTGIMAGIESLRGTHIRNTGNAFEIRAGSKEVVLAMHLVDTPCTALEAKVFGFYLEATPSHPKNMECAMLPREKLCHWTGVLGRFFDVMIDGMVNEKACAQFRERQEKGEHVHYYFTLKGTSPYQPWWGRFGQDWSRFNDPAFWLDERKRPSVGNEAKEREVGCWTRTCMNDRNFTDHKIWQIGYMLDAPKYNVENLYLDLAQPGDCSNDRHGCAWLDDFGVRRKTWDVRATRNACLRIYRLLKSKNPEGVIIGHSGTYRGPSDVFLDRIMRGEHYLPAVARNNNYYDVLTPEDMQVKYASRANEYVIDMIPEIVGSMVMFGRIYERNSYDPLLPDSDRAIRHATAYFKIHDLLIAPTKADGPQWSIAEKNISRLGKGRKFKAYYHLDCPVTVSCPGRLFLYAWFNGNGKTIVILLNDTDDTVVQNVSVKGLSGIGKDIYGANTLDLSSGTALVTLPPRESRFYLFE